MSPISTDALSGAPSRTVLFFGSIVSMEGIFFLYYYKWTLFQMLPVLELSDWWLS